MAARTAPPSLASPAHVRPPVIGPPGIPRPPLPPRSKYEVLNLKVVHRRHCTGFEQARELPLHIDDLIAGRYQVGGAKEVLGGRAA